MAIELSKTRAVASLAFSCLIAGTALGANPTVEDVLRFQPAQQDVQIDRPQGAEIAKCTLKPEKSAGKVGWVVRDSAGQILRNFVDTNGDNSVDQWGYYKDGVEVYRDIDSNFNKKPDQYRWLNTAGTRWGIDKNEDAKIDGWKSISAEEATAELVAALRDKDRARFERLLLTPAEAKALGLGTAKTDLLIKKIEMAPAAFAKLASQQKAIGAESKWVSFGGTQPGLVPAGTEDSTTDLMVYENVMAMIETGDKPQAITVGSIVRVKDVWRLIDVPLISEDSTAESDPKTFFYAVQRSEKSDTPVGVAKPNKRAEELMEQLNKLGDLSGDITDKQREQRAELLETLAKEADSDDMRNNWYRQLADTISATVQQGNYPAGLDRLKTVYESLKQNPKDDELAFYVQFRYMTAEHGQALSAPNANFATIQTKWVEDLEKFVDEAKKYPDSADAMLELAISQEFAGDEAKSLKWYDAITKDFPTSIANRKAQGAKLRMQSVGRPIPLKGLTVNNKPFDLARDLKGKVVLVQYWATWCEPCKSDMPLLKELRAKYGKGGGFEVVGVCLDTNKKDMMTFLHENDPHWIQLFEEGGMDSPLANQLGIQTLPTMILIDKDGKVVNRNIKAQDIDAELKKLTK